MKHKVSAPKVPSEKPSLKHKGARIQEKANMPLGKTQPHACDESKSVRDSFKGNDK